MIWTVLIKEMRGAQQSCKLIPGQEVSATIYKTGREKTHSSAFSVVFKIWA